MIMVDFQNLGSTCPNLSAAHLGQFLIDQTAQSTRRDGAVVTLRPAVGAPHDGCRLSAYHPLTNKRSKTQFRVVRLILGPVIRTLRGTTMRRTRRPFWVD